MCKKEKIEKFFRKEFNDIINGKGITVPRIAVEARLDQIFTNWPFNKGNRPDAGIFEVECPRCAAWYSLDVSKIKR